MCLYKSRYKGILPYFAQSAKIFSQGKYYVWGPRNVQIWHNVLLTNTLIMRFCLFIVAINCCLSRNIKNTCAPVCVFIVTVSTRECPSLASSLTKQIPHYLPKWSYWSKFKFRIPHWPNFSFGEVISYWLAIQFSRPQTYVNKQFWGSLTGTPTERIMPQSDRSLGFHYKKKPSCKTRNNLTVDGCSVQAQAFQCL
jgi:hypothetical protein